MNDPATPSVSNGRLEMLRARVIDVLRTVYDPEIPVNIYDLGLIYALEIDEASGKVFIRMTLTAPACPVAQSLLDQVGFMVTDIEGVSDVEIELVWDPPWSMQMISEAGRLELGLA